MPITPLPDNNVPTLFVHYQVRGKAHTFQLRCTAITNFDALIAKAKAFADALMPVADPSWTVTGADWRVDGGIVALPVTPPAIITATGSVQSDINNPRELRFVGRGTVTGRRVTVSLYGIGFDMPANYRIPASGNANIENAIEALNAADVATATTIAGDTALWYPYANVNYNSHWETEART